MHIVVLCEDFYPTVSGGAHTRWHFSRLAAKDHKITVFTPKTSNTARKERVEGVDIIRPFRAEPSRFPSYAGISIITRIIYSIFLFCYLLLWMKGESVDGVHSTDHSLHWVASAISRLFRIPHVSFVGYSPSIHSVSSWEPRYILEQINFTFFMGNYAFCRTPEVKASIKNAGTDADIVHGILDHESIVKAATSVNRAELRDNYDIEKTDDLLVFVGRISLLKRVELCIDILASIENGYKLMIVGSGPERDKIEQYVSEKGLESDVQFTGYLPHEKALEIIAAAEGLLVTSKAESYSAVALEALSLNTSVFATPVGVLSQIEHPDLHLAKPKDIPELIRNTEFNDDICLDRETLDDFSMERYTKTILTKFTQLSD